MLDLSDLNHNSELGRRPSGWVAALLEQERSISSYLVTSIAHDLNNALAVMETNIFLLRDVSGEKTGELADEVEQAIDQAVELTAQLSCLIRGTSSGPPRATLAHLLAQTETSLRQLIGSAGVDLRVTVAPSARDAWLDPAPGVQLVGTLLLVLLGVLPASGGVLDVSATLEAASTAAPDGRAAITLLASHPSFAEQDILQAKLAWASKAPGTMMAQTLARRLRGDVKIARRDHSVSIEVQLRLISPDESPI